MKRKYLLLSLLIVAVLLLAGCSMTTVEQMYQLPKRSENFNDLQSAIGMAMGDMEYCAPLAGENRQTVHMADLDGDGQDEYILFAKNTQEKPLRILVFRKIDNAYVNVDTVECNGSGFDQVEYVDLDGRAGLEMVVGCQLNDQVIRSASVYNFASGELVQWVSVNYTKFLITDLDSDSLSELFVLKPGISETDNGVAEIYQRKKGTRQRCNEVSLSQPADKLKRIIQGKLDGGKNAVYAASIAGDTALVTDIYTLLDGKLVNVALSNSSGTNVRTLRNYYVYADDIDGDGVVELPAIIPMHPIQNMSEGEPNYIIRWYAMTSGGKEVDKMYTYHNFLGGWYLQLDSRLASRTVADDMGNTTEFFLWDKKFETYERVLTIYELTGQNRAENALSNGRFVLHKTDLVVYSAFLEKEAAEYGLTNESVVYNFRLIQLDWKTGET